MMESEPIESPCRRKYPPVPRSKDEIYKAFYQALCRILESKSNFSLNYLKSEALTILQCNCRRHFRLLIPTSINEDIARLEAERYIEKNPQHKRYYNVLRNLKPITSDSERDALLRKWCAESGSVEPSPKRWKKYKNEKKRYLAKWRAESGKSIKKS